MSNISFYLEQTCDGVGVSFDNPELENNKEFISSLLNEIYPLSFIDSSNPDEAEKYGTEIAMLLEHWIRTGLLEKRYGEWVFYPDLYRARAEQGRKHVEEFSKALVDTLQEHHDILIDLSK